jgi:hypothetical protein
MCRLALWYVLGLVLAPLSRAASQGAPDSVNWLGLYACMHACMRACMHACAPGFFGVRLRDELKESEGSVVTGSSGLRVRPATACTACR